jgi:hypothetical protein
MRDENSRTSPLRSEISERIDVQQNSGPDRKRGGERTAAVEQDFFRFFRTAHVRPVVVLGFALGRAYLFENKPHQRRLGRRRKTHPMFVVAGSNNSNALVS